MGDFCLVNKVAPYFRNYQKGDIVVFSHELKDYVARIIALENDAIKLSDWQIELNGKLLKEKNVSRNWSDWSYGDYAINEQYKVPDQHVFVLSDNLAAHFSDSRSFGPIPMSSIIGVVW